MRVSLAYDADEAGQRAAEKGVEALSDWLTSWGTPRSAGPTATALAAAQEAYDAAARRWATLDALATDDMSADLATTLAAAHRDLDDVAEYVLHLVDRLDDDRPYLTAQTADELIEATKVHRVVEDIRHLDWAALRERTDLVAFAEQYTTFRQRGRALVGKCILPDHHDETPSLHLYPDQRNWYCFGCGRWGDIFDLAKALGVALRDLTAY
jgi:CHC2 zinc finger